MVGVRGFPRSLVCRLERLLLLLLLGSEGFAVRKGWLATMYSFLAERSLVSRLCRHYYLSCWLRGRGGAP